jgi:hypothetical protein
LVIAAYLHPRQSVHLDRSSGAFSTDEWGSRRRDDDSKQPHGMESRPSFRVRDARDAGVGPGALRSVHLAAPFHGVRSLVEPASVEELCRAYATKMRRDAAFSSLTAARLWGIPLPSAHASLPRLDVTTPHGAPRPLGRGVRGSQHDRALFDVVELDGLRVLSPASTWVALAPILGMADLVAAGDYLVTRRFGDPRPALCEPGDLQELLDRGRRIGAGRLREALSLIVPGSLSRPESLCRVLFVTAGLPRPVPNLRISPLLMFDDAWPEWRVAFDYHGDDHRSATQYARDVGRVDLARQAGWSLIQGTKRDLFETPFDLVGRVRGRLVARGASIRLVHPSKVARAKP